ncbi:MAG: PAS domain-containing sensor histidine kinase, partial [Aggregatilineales bacterium]
DARLAAVLNSSNISFTLINADRKIVVLNDLTYNIANRIYGTHPAIGMHMHDMIPAAIVDAFEKHFQQALAGETVTIQRKLHGVDNQDYWIEFQYFPVRMSDDDVTGVCLRTEDITARKRAELALKEAEYRYRTVADFSSDWTYWIREDGRVDYMSPACEMITGYTVYDFLQDDNLFHDIVHPDDRQAWSDHYHQDIDHETTRYMQFQIMHREGHIVWLEHLCRRVINEEGVMDGYHVTNRDITERRDAEQARLQLQVEQERVALLDSFIKDVTHEFRSPLSIINGSVHLLNRTDDEKIKARKIEQISVQTRRITGLVDGLLLMTRLDTVKPDSKQPVRVNMLLQMLEQSLYEHLKKKQVSVVFNLADKLPAIQGYMTFLNDGLSQILQNAIRYTPENSTICISTYPLDNGIGIVIEDEGEGIPEARMEQVFERFYRLDGAHSTEGMGLGLPIMKRVVELHDGQIGLENREEDGLRVIIELPVSS